MPQEFRLSLYVALVGGLIIYGVSFFPALTTSGPPGATAASQARYETVFSGELSYCEGSSQAMDCQCFANISGYIQAEQSTRVSGMAYADKMKLARSQAAGSC